MILKKLPQWLRFGIVGVVGFAIDTTLLAIFFYGLGWRPMLARAPGFVLGVATTWVLNSRLTFELAQPLELRNFMCYFVSNVVGMAINWAIYTACLHTHNIFMAYPFLAIIPASGTAMFFNYMMAKFMLFAGKGF